MTEFYVVERETLDDDHIITRIVAGPFDDLDEAESVSDSFDKSTPIHSIHWYDVWDRGSLEERGFL